MNCTIIVHLTTTVFLFATSLAKQVHGHVLYHRNGQWENVLVKTKPLMVVAAPDVHTHKGIRVANVRKPKMRSVTDTSVLLYREIECQRTA